MDDELQKRRHRASLEEIRELSEAVAESAHELNHVELPAELNPLDVFGEEQRAELQPYLEIMTFCVGRVLNAGSSFTEVQAWLSRMQAIWGASLEDQPKEDLTG